MFKPANVQYSCTCLQYDIDFDKVPAALEMAKELYFKIEDSNSAFGKGYRLKRAIDARLTECGKDWILEYSDRRDNYHVPDDFQRALDCLRLSFIGADLSAGGSFYYGEPTTELDTGMDYSFQMLKGEDIYLDTAPWLFANITNKCNLDCKFCYNKKDETEMTAEMFGQSLQGFKQSLRKGLKDPGVTIGGGEPTIHTELEKILETAKEKIGLVTLTTNGTNKKRLISLKDYLDGICISAPFIYTDELTKYSGQNNEKTKESIAELAQEFNDTCIATIVTNKMQPDDVFKIDELAEELGATNTLFLMYKPIKTNALMPVRKHSRDILEKILELSFNKKNTSIDCCFTAYAVRPQPACSFDYIKPDGILRKSGWQKPCPFDEEYDCLMKYAPV